MQLVIFQLLKLHSFFSGFFHRETLKWTQGQNRLTLLRKYLKLILTQLCGKPDNKNVSSPLRFGVNVRFLQGVRLTAMK